MAANKLTTEQRSSLARVKSPLYHRINNRRQELIYKKYDKGLTDEEAKELVAVTAEVRKRMAAYTKELRGSV